MATQLPGGGWPTGAQIDLLVQQPGIGEIRLVAPALRRVAARKILFIGPPHGGERRYGLFSLKTNFTIQSLNRGVQFRLPSFALGVR